MTSRAFGHSIVPLAAGAVAAQRAWADAASTVAASLFLDANLIRPAGLIAELQPCCIDYIAQAPAMVVALAAGRRFASEKERLRLTVAALIACQDRPRLNMVMRRCGLRPPLRRLSGHALRAEHHGILRLLSTLPSSALAQAIPADVAGQFRWLTLLGAWVRRSRLRCDPPDTRFAWAAVGLGRALSSEVSEGEVDDICDLVRTLAAFNPRWTWPQAVAAPERRRPAAVAERRVPEAGVPAVPAPRASPPRLESPAAPPLPLRCFHFHAHDFIALQHAEDIREEGAQMHNCVHSYLEHVAAGRSVLFSLRREGGRAATLELVNVSDASRRRYIVGQLFGPCNAPPPDKAVTATAAFVAHLDAELAREQAARDEGYRLAAARGRLISLCLVRVMAEVPGGRLL